MTFALLVVILAIGWAAATGTFTLLNLGFGALIGALGLWLLRDRVRGPRIWQRVGRMFLLAGLFLRELLVSAFRVAVLVARPDMRRHLRPQVVAFPLTLTNDAQITLLANMITLTPGTLSVDVSDDRKLLYVHAIDCPDRDALIRSIAEGFERKIAEAFQ